MLHLLLLVVLTAGYSMDCLRQPSYNHSKYTPSKGYFVWLIRLSFDHTFYRLYLIRLYTDNHSCHHHILLTSVMPTMLDASTWDRPGSPGHVVRNDSFYFDHFNFVFAHGADEFSMDSPLPLIPDEAQTRRLESQNSIGSTQAFDFVSDILKK